MTSPMVLLMRRVLTAAVALWVLAGAVFPVFAREGVGEARVEGAESRVLTRAAGAEVGRLIRFDFPVTHAAIRWEGHEGASIRYRVLGLDGSFGKWFVTSEAHDLESGETHSTGVLYLGKALGIEWHPVDGETRARFRGLDSGEVFYMDAGSGETATSTFVAEQTDPSDPTIVTRAQWGADESLKSTEGGCKRFFYPVQQLFVHHTAGRGYAPPYDDDMRAIYAYHTQGNGWCDVGYNFVIAPDGTIFEARWARPYSSWETHNGENRSGRAVAGAHVGGYNSGSVGVSLMGDFTSDTVSKAARASLIQMLAWESDRHDLDPMATHTYVNPSSGAERTLPVIAGHRDAGETACPGTTLYRDLKSIREEVAVAVGTGRPSSSLSLNRSASKVDHGSSVTLSGQLTANGSPMMGKTAIMYFKQGRSGWAELTRFITSATGEFSFTHTPERTSQYEVAFFGDSTAWGSGSARRKVPVKPKVELSATGDATDNAGVVHRTGSGPIVLEGEVDPGVKGKVVIKIFKIRSDGSEKLVKTKEVILSAGAFSTGYRVRAEGKTYRAVAWYPRTKLLAAARSNPVHFTADPTP